MKKNNVPVKFYLSLAVALVVIAAIIGLTASGVFNALKTSNEVDEDLLNNASPLINQQDLKNAFDSFTNKKTPTLDAL